jgi:hypothetical protein
MKSSKSDHSLIWLQFFCGRPYLRAVGRKHGLILNFAKALLQPKREIIE